MMEQQADKKAEAMTSQTKEAQEALEAWRELPEHLKFQQVVFSDEYVLFSGTKVVQEKFFLFQKEQDRLLLEEYDRRVAEREKEEKWLRKEVGKLLAYRFRDYAARAHNPPVLFEEVFDAFQSDHGNTMANSARKWGLDPGKDTFNEAVAVPQEMDQDGLRHTTMYDNLHEEEYFVYNNLNKLRFCEITHDIGQEDYADFSALLHQELKDFLPGHDTLPEIGIYNFDPVAIMESKRKHWEGIAGVTQEELRKVGVDAAPKSWPFYPPNTPIIMGLRDPQEESAANALYKLPPGALKWYLDFFRKRLHTDSALPDGPRYDPEEPTVCITRDQHWEPIASLKMSQDRKFLTKRVKMQFQLDDFKLPPIAKERMIAILGDRYNNETGEVYLSSDKKPSARENTLYLKHIIRELLHESLLALPQYISPGQSEQPRLLPPPTGHAKVNVGAEEGFALFHFPPPQMKANMSM